MKQQLLSVAVALAVSIALPASAGIIDFEDVAIGAGGNIVGGDLISGGYFFDSSENESHRVHAHPDYADSGSTYLLFHSVLFNNTITMSPIGGGTFRLNSIQLSEGYTPASGNASLNATSVFILGNLFGGGTVTKTVILDGINDGPGGVADFQLETFDATWDNLTSVVFDGLGGEDGRMGIDNIIVNVPEPSSFALGTLGALAWLWRRNHRKA
jgi:hypothetical protein